MPRLQFTRATAHLQFTRATAQSSSAVPSGHFSSAAPSGMAPRDPGAPSAPSARAGLPETATTSEPCAPASPSVLSAPPAPSDPAAPGALPDPAAAAGHNAPWRLTDRARGWRVLTWPRARFYILAIAAVLVFAWVQSIVDGTPPLNAAGAPIGGDYIAFYAAGRLVLSGQAPLMYDHDTVARLQQSLLGNVATGSNEAYRNPPDVSDASRTSPGSGDADRNPPGFSNASRNPPGFYDAYRNPPFLALLYAPLALLDLLPSLSVWTAFSAACVAAACWLMLQRLPSLRPSWRGVLLAVFAFGPVYFNLVDGENAAVSLLLYTLLYGALVDGHERRAGLWAALGLFKPQLFFVFPLLFVVTRRWRALAVYGLVAAGLAALSLALVGPAGVLAWLHGLLETEALNAAHNAWRMLSLATFFQLVVPDSPLLAFALYAAASLALLVLLLRAWRTPAPAADLPAPAAPADRPSPTASADLPRLWCMTSLVAVLVDPHLVDYDLSVLVPAALLAVVHMPRARWPMVLFYGLILFRGALPIGSSSSTLQLGTLLLLGCLIVAWPRVSIPASWIGLARWRDGCL